MEGVCLEVSPVLWGGVVARAAGLFLRDVDVLAGEPPCDPGEEWQLLPEELDAPFLEVGWDVCWAQCRVVEGDLQFLLKLLDVCSAVCVTNYVGQMLDGVGVMVCSVVKSVGGVLWYPVLGLMGLRFLGVCVGGLCGFGRGRGPGGSGGVLCAGVLPCCRPYNFRIGTCGILVSRCVVGRRGEGCEALSRVAVLGC